MKITACFWLVGAIVLAIGTVFLWGLVHWIVKSILIIGIILCLLISFVSYMVGSFTNCDADEEELEEE